MTKNLNVIFKAQVIFHLKELNECSKNDNGDDPSISIFTEIEAKNAFYRAYSRTYSLRGFGSKKYP